MKTLFVAALLAVVCYSPLVLAGARQHYQAGADYYSQGRYEKAIEEFEEAYRLDSTKHLILYNVAQAYEKTGDLKKAVEYLELYLERDPETEDRATCLNKIENLKARIADTGIQVQCNQDGAVIYVDKKEVGTTPVDAVIPLDPGAHHVTISKNGFKSFELNIAVSYGFSVPVEAVLEPGQSAPPPAAAGVREEAAPAREQAAEEKAGKKVDALDVVPWVLAGVGGAAAIAGLGVLGGMALSGDDHDQAVIADIVGWSGVGVFVAGAVWGIVRVVQKKKSGEQPTAEPVAVVPVVDRHGGGVAASFAF